MKTKDKEEILKNIDKVKQGVKNELKSFEKDNAKALDGFTQKEKVLILYYMVTEQSHEIKEKARCLVLDINETLFNNGELPKDAYLMMKNKMTKGKWHNDRE